MNQQQLLELNASDMPFEDCDYFKWLGEYGDDLGFRMDNLKNYLESHGISPPIYSDELRSNLRFIHEHFYWIKFESRKLTKA